MSKDIETLKRVRDLFVMRRRGAAAHIQAVMDADPEQIEHWTAKFVRSQEIIETIDRALADEQQIGQAA